MTNSAQKKSSEKFNNVLAIDSALENFKSIKTAETGGERLKKIAGLIATAYGMK